jgi:hypothetical protein
MAIRHKTHLPLLGLLLSLAPALAQAHSGDSTGSCWNNGFNHPLQGIDHLLTMVTVGIWAAQLGGRAVWQLPLAFVGVMGLGGLVGMMGVSVPGVEMMILLSVLVFAFLVVRVIRVQATASILIVVFFAFFSRLRTRPGNACIGQFVVIRLGVYVSDDAAARRGHFNCTFGIARLGFYFYQHSLCPAVGGQN